MKFKKQVSILLTLVMLISTLISTVPLPVMAQDGDTPPLELISINPGNNVSLEGIDEELSITFNQAVAIGEGKQIQFLYDKEGDGIPDDSVLVQEQGEEGQETPEPHDGIFGDKGEYNGILTIDEQNPAQVKVDLSYQQQPLIEKNHVYRLNIYQVIKTMDGQQTFHGLGVEEEQETWIFDTHTDNEITSIEITGEDTVNQDESITLKARVKNQYQNTLLNETVTWTGSDESMATVDKNGEVTGVSPGSVNITAASDSNGEISAQKEINVQGEKDCRPDEKASLQVQSPQSLSVKIKGDSLLQLGYTKALEAVVMDEEGNEINGQSVNWSSDNTEIITVDARGEVTGQSLGAATITAALSSDPSIKDTLEITVGDPGSYNFFASQTYSRRMTMNEDFLGAAMNDGVVYGINETAKDSKFLTSSNLGNLYKIYAFDLYGHELWSIPIDVTKALHISNCSILPAFGDDGTIYMQLYDGTDSRNNTGRTLVYAISPGGEILWQKEIGEGSVSSSEPLIMGSQLIITTQSKVYSMDINNSGSINWSYDYASDQSPVTDGTNLYLLKKDKIQVLSTLGEEKWSCDLGSNTGVIAPAFNNDKSKMYIVYDQKEIRIIHPSTGEVISDDPLNGYTLKYERNPSIGNILIDNNDVIYLGASFRSASGTTSLGQAIISINPDGTTRYTYESDYLTMYTVDKEGYIYARKGVDEGSAVYVINPYGTQVETIPVTVSSIAGYRTMKVYGDVYIGARKKAGDVRVYGIQRDSSKSPASISILEKNKEMGINLNETLAVAVKDSQGSALMGQSLEWTSSDPKVVEVNPNGTLKCKKIGTATITVTIKGTGISDSTTVQVVNKPSVPISLEITSPDIDVTRDDNKIELNQPCTFDTLVRDQYGEIMPGEKGYFSASIDKLDGSVFYPQNTGAATITAQLNVNDDYFMDSSNSVQVTVEKRQAVFSSVLPKESIMTIPGTLSLKTGNQYDELYQQEGVTWKSSDESIATVNSDGVVTAVSYGKVNITATAPGGARAVGQVNVLPSLGYQWNVQSTSNVSMDFEDRIATDNEENDYYLNPNRETLKSVDHEGNQRWEKITAGNISYLKIGSDDKLYYIIDNKIICINTDNGATLWESTPAANSLRENIQLGSDGTLYAVERGRPGNIYAYNPDGSLKWTYTMEDAGNNYLSTQFKLDNQGNLIFLAPDGNDTNYYKIKDSGDAQIVESQNYKNCQFNYGYDFQVNEEGTVYFQYQEKSDEENNRYGICAVDGEDVLWKYYVDSSYSSFEEDKLTLSSSGNLYFTSGSAAELSSNKTMVYSLDRDGNENWTKEFQDMAVPGDSIVGSGAYAVDMEENIYIPLREKTGRDETKSMVLVLNKDGQITKYISYNVEKYDKFSDICISKDSVYVGGHISGQYIVKLPMENNMAHRPDEVLITAPKTSMVEGDYMQLTAKVYSQLGNLMPDEQVIWSSSHENKATVDETGKVRGLKAGTVTLTAKCISNQEIKSTITLTIRTKGAHYVNRETIDGKINAMTSYYQKTGIDGEWTAFGLGALGEDINSQAYMTNNKTYMARKWDDISSRKNLGNMTEYEKAVLSILVGGYDPTSFAGMNLIEKIYNFPNLNQGNNAVMWGLIALDAAGAAVPEGARWNQQYLVDFMLNNKSGKGWGLVTSGPPDVDLTSMAITALAPYYNGWEEYKNDEVKAAVDEALAWLKTQQNDNGSFNYSDGNTITNTESTAWAIMALVSLGIDPQGDEYTQAGGNPVSALLENQLPDGTFEHFKGEGSNGMATYQALYCMAAINRYYEKGYSDIFYHIAGEEPVEIEPYLELITDINKLPEEADEITLKHESLVQELRARYNALSKEQQEKVTNIDRLIRAENRIKILKDHIAPGISTNLTNKKVTDKTLKFNAKAIDNVKGEFIPEVKLNGKQIKTITGNKYSYTVTLKEGKNTITIIAVDDNNNKTQQTYTITYEPKKQQGGKDEGTNNTGVNNTTGGSSQTTGAGNGGGSQGEEDQDETPDNEATKHLREAISKNMEETQSGDTISIELEEGAVLDAEMLNKLKEKENVTVIFKGEGYTISFNTSDIGDYDEDFEMNLNMSFTSDNEETIKEKIGSENALILHFDYHGELPVPMTVVVKLPDDLKDKDPLYLYYYNETTGEMEMVEEANLIIQDGYAQFTITHCSDYTITDAVVAGVSTEEDTTVSETPTPTEKAQETGINMTLIIILIAGILLVGILAVVLYNRKKQNQ